MHYRRRFWLEKVTVQAALVVAVALLAVGLGAVIRCRDPFDGVSFLLDGNLAGLAMATGALWLLAAAAGPALTHVRPVGAMLVVAAGGAGMCLRSPWARPWLWSQTGNYPRMFIVWIIELLVLTFILIVAGVIMDATRRLAADRWGWQLWTDPGKDDDDTPHVNPPYLDLLGGVGAMIADARTNGPAGHKRLMQTLGGMAVMVAISITLVTVFLKSPERGQVLFAVLASTALAAYITLHLLPVRVAMAALLVPLLTGLAFYALAISSAPAGQGPTAWVDVKLYAQVLPIDWVFAGSTGTMLGCWLGHRVFEAGYMEKRNED